jgi:hypothetical protein
MVLHAGIVCYEKTKTGKLVIYNTETKERITKDVIAVGPGDNSGVDELFKSIKSHFARGKLGCLSVCLGNKYDSEIRSKFIEAGKVIGFTKVGITDWLSADYCDLVSSTDVFGSFKDQKGFIWIVCGRSCRIWKKTGDKAKFIKEMAYDGTVENLEKIQSGGKPDLIIYGSTLKPPYKQVQGIFGEQKVRVYTNLNQENGALIKARIMSGENEMKKYGTEIHLEREVELKLGGVSLFSAKIRQGLPFSKNIEIEKPDGVTELEMFSYFVSNKKWLPDARKFTVKFNIDQNGICKVDFDVGPGQQSNANDNFPTETKQKKPFTPRQPGQSSGQSNGKAKSQPQAGQPGTKGVVRTNMAKQKFASTSVLNDTKNQNAKGGGRNQRKVSNVSEEDGSGIQNPGYPANPYPPPFLHGYPPNHMNQAPQYGAMNQGIPHNHSFPAQPPYHPGYQSPPYQPPYSGYGQMHPNFPQHPYPQQPMNQPPYNPNPQFGNLNINSPPPPYAEASNSSSSKGKQRQQPHDYQKPAFQVFQDPLSQGHVWTPESFSNNGQSSGNSYPTKNNAKDKKDKSKR